VVINTMKKEMSAWRFQYSRTLGRSEFRMPFRCRLSRPFFATYFELSDVLRGPHVHRRSSFPPMSLTLEDLMGEQSRKPAQMHSFTNSSAKTSFGRPVAPLQS